MVQGFSMAVAGNGQPTWTSLTLSHRPHPHPVTTTCTVRCLRIGMHAHVQYVLFWDREVVPRTDLPPHNSIKNGVCLSHERRKHSWCACVRVCVHERVKLHSTLLFVEDLVVPWGADS